MNKPREIQKAFDKFSEAEHRWLTDPRSDDYDAERLHDSINSFWSVYYGR